jgi:acetoin utilization protein AcuC
VSSEKRFFFHPGAFDYDFGPQHPLRPERLRRTLRLMEAVGLFEEMPVEEPPFAPRDDLLRCHSSEYLHAVEQASAGAAPELAFNLRASDNPAFPGMWEASLAYTGASIAAAKAVRDGASVAFNISGGLHHAARAKAAGFCIFNDVAIACSILRDRFERVAYVDIDLHHGDGVQWLFYDDPTVLTVSIHQDPRTLFPGTGFVDEVGTAAGHGSSINIPMPPSCTDRLWFGAFEATVRRAFELFRPEAVVMQMGTDPHYLDPLGHLSLTAQGWLRAVELIAGYGLPTVATGGGGYELTTVPRMWTLACACLAGRTLPETVPEEVAGDLGIPKLLDDDIVPDVERTERLLAEPVSEVVQKISFIALKALEEMMS